MLTHPWFLSLEFICPVSNPNYKVISGSCYYIENTSTLNYADAQLNCQDKFGNLVGGLIEPRLASTNQLVYAEALNFKSATSDDFWDADFIKKNIQILEKNKNVVGSISKIALFNNFNDLKLKRTSLSKVLQFQPVQYITGSYEEKVLSYLKFNSASHTLGIYQTEILKKSTVKLEYGGWDLWILLKALKFGDLYVVDEVLMYRSINGESSNSIFLQYLVSKIGIFNTFFPYYPITRYCIRHLGIFFFLQNILTFIKLNAFGELQIIKSIINLFKKNIKF